MKKFNNEQKKVVVIGLDGATLDLIGPWAADGTLPAIRSLMSSGSWGQLSSTKPPISAIAWSTFMTGKNAGKHNIFDFYRRRKDSYDLELLSASNRAAPAIWDILSEAGKKVIVLNVPLTFPPNEVNGIMISGFDSPKLDQKVFYPSEIMNEIIQHFGEYCMHELIPTTQKKHQYIDIVDKFFENHVQVAKYLMQKYPWDFFMIVFTATDVIQHIFWNEMELGGKYSDIIRQTYIKADSAISDILEIVSDSATKFIVSDHGAGKIRGLLYIDNWLNINNMLVYKGREDDKGFVRSASNRILHSFSFWNFRMLNKIGVYLHPKVKGFILSKMPTLKSKIKLNRGLHCINWKLTKAYSYGSFPNIYINSYGREPEGIVKRGIEYEKVCKEITDALLKLQDPHTMQNVVKQVHRGHEIFEGRYQSIAPDLLIEWHDGYYAALSYGDHNFLFGEKYRVTSRVGSLSGGHKPEGILIVNGKNIKNNGYQIAGANIVDLVPTILYSMGHPVLNDMDGRVLREVFTTNFLKYNTEKFRSTGDKMLKDFESDKNYSDSERQILEDRLKKLGYL